MGMNWRGIDVFCKSKHWMNVWMNRWRKILWKIGYFRWSPVPMGMRVAGGCLYATWNNLGLIANV